MLCSRGEEWVYEMWITKFFHFLTLGANPWAKGHQRGDDPLPTQVYHPAKFHHPASTRTGDIPYKNVADKQTNKQ